MDANFFYELVGLYGLIAIFILAALEGDITLLLAGVLAHSGFFGEWSFVKVVAAGTLGAVISDHIAYLLGHGVHSGAENYRFYRAVRPRVERLAENFGASAMLLSKYIWGLRSALCMFYGVVRMPYRRFLPLSFAACFIWVLTLSGAGYFFNSAISNLIGDFHQIGIGLFVIVVIGIGGFYLAERYWLSKKVEEVNPESVHRIEHAAQEKLHEIQEHIPMPARKRKNAKRARAGAQSFPVKTPSTKVKPTDT